MKIKFLLSVAVLVGMLSGGVAMAKPGDSELFGVGGGSSTPLPGDMGVFSQDSSLQDAANAALECKVTDIETIKDGKKGCEDGKKFCEDKPKPTDTDFEYAFDPTSKACYLKIKNADVGQFSILPFTALTVEQCEAVYKQDSSSIGLFKDFLEGTSTKAPAYPTDIKDAETNKYIEKEVSKLDILGCGIKTGRMKLWMIPYYIKFLIQFALSIAGIVAVGAMVVGGYLYMFGSIMDDKERGKRSIIYGIGGFVLVLLAWAIVNVVISLATM